MENIVNSDLKENLTIMPKRNKKAVISLWLLISIFPAYIISIFIPPLPITYNTLDGIYSDVHLTVSAIVIFLLLPLVAIFVLILNVISIQEIIYRKEKGWVLVVISFIVSLLYLWLFLFLMENPYFGRM